MNILILHKLGNPALAPHFLVRHVFALANNDKTHNYIYHDCHLPVPVWVKEFEFDAIVLDVTLLCIRWAPQEVFERTMTDLEFVKNSHGVKVAMPQDEYDCNAILDQWMVEWKIDIVYSVLPEHHDVLYPKYALHGDIKLAYTGYIDESSINLAKPEFHERPIDIGYRARKLPAYFGRIGQEKELVGLKVAEAAKQYALKTDIRIGIEHALAGKSWLEFLGRSKFTLGSNSGSSLLDPVGDIKRKVYDFVWRHPDASFEDIEAACFPGQDGTRQFTAISPRILEAAILESCQLLVPGQYSGIFKPWEHYIPIKADGSDFSDANEAMNDPSLVLPMIKRARETILLHPGLRYANQSSELLISIANKVSSRPHSSAPAALFDRIKKRHNEYVRRHEKWLFMRQKLRSQVIAHVTRFPQLNSMLRSIYHSRRR